MGSTPFPFSQAWFASTLISLSCFRQVLDSNRDAFDTNSFMDRLSWCSQGQAYSLVQFRFFFAILCG